MKFVARIQCGVAATLALAGVDLNWPSRIGQTGGEQYDYAECLCGQLVRDLHQWEDGCHGLYRLPATQPSFGKDIARVSNDDRGAGEGQCGSGNWAKNMARKSETEVSF